MYQDQYEQEEVKSKGLTTNALLPLFGLLLAIALGAIAYVLSAPVHELIIEQFPNNVGLAEPDLQYVIAGALFVMMLAFVSLVYAAFAPKPDRIVPESELKKEKMLKERERKARKRRKQESNRREAKERNRQQ